MYTTNTASKSSPVTYTTRRKECEQLLEIAKTMEAIAVSKKSFSDDAEFEKLEAQYKEVFSNLASLIL